MHIAYTIFPKSTVKGNLIDIGQKRFLKSIPFWDGTCTKVKPAYLISHPFPHSLTDSLVVHSGCHAIRDPIVCSVSIGPSETSFGSVCTYVCVCSFYGIRVINKQFD